MSTEIHEYKSEFNPNPPFKAGDKVKVDPDFGKPIGGRISEVVSCERCVNCESGWEVMIKDYPRPLSASWLKNASSVEGFIQDSKDKIREVNQQHPARWFYVRLKDAIFGLGAKNDVIFFVGEPKLSWMLGKKLQDVREYLIANKGVEKGFILELKKEPTQDDH